MDKPSKGTSNISPGRKRITVDIDETLHEELLDAVVYAQHNGRPGITKSGTIHDGIRRAIDNLLDLYELEQFPKRTTDPKPGARPTHARIALTHPLERLTE